MLGRVDLVPGQKLYRCDAFFRRMVRSGRDLCRIGAGLLCLPFCESCSWFLFAVPATLTINQRNLQQRGALTLAA